MKALFLLVWKYHTIGVKPPMRRRNASTPPLDHRGICTKQVKIYLYSPVNGFSSHKKVARIRFAIWSRTVKIIFRKNTAAPATRTEAIPNTIVLYRPKFWSYISIWFEFIDSHTNFYLKRCPTTKTLCWSEKLVTSIAALTCYMACSTYTLFYIQITMEINEPKP